MDRNKTDVADNFNIGRSLSARRAWIEITLGGVKIGSNMSLSARRAWIEIECRFLPGYTQRSLSARRAWIEIMDDLEPSKTRRVALRKESVDRNYYCYCQ